jgi:hypothetical protein
VVFILGVGFLGCKSAGGGACLKGCESMSKWPQEQLDYLFELKQKNLTWNMIAEKMTMKFNKRFSREKVKAKYLRNRHLIGKEETYKETVEIKKDGSQYSDKLIEMSAEQSKDPEYLLRAHGYDVNKWDLVNARSNIWHTYSVQDGKTPSYASQISVKPKTTNEFEKLLTTIENQKPFNIKVQPRQLQNHHLLEVAPVDTHFGISSYEYYIPNQTRIIDRIKSKHWSEVIIPVGNDLFHNDDFRGRTSSGREIQKVGMREAWLDAEKFYYPIIDEAAANSNNVKIIYVRGNHDESMSWAFVRNLMTKYPSMEFDDSFQEHKAHTFHKVFVGLTHGEKNRKNTTKIFNSKYRMEIAKAKVREIHQAHLHGEDATTKDDYGIMLRTLSTQNQEDEWHDQNGYVGKNKRFMLFEYSKDALEGIYYV